MPSFLLDQQISPAVARQIQNKRPDIPIVSLYGWCDGVFVGAADLHILDAAAADAVTLVTYDRRTIPPLLSELGILNVSHGGVLFVDNRTIAPSDLGRLVRALIEF